MMTNSTQTQQMPGAILGRVATTLVVAFGPILSVAFLVSSVARHASWIPADALAPILAAVLFMWSPMPISFPALLLQDARDAALPEMTGFVGSFWRSFLLIPYLMTAKESSVRVEMTASVLGVVVGLVYALPHFIG